MKSRRMAQTVAEAAINRLGCLWFVQMAAVGASLCISVQSCNLAGFVQIVVVVDYPPDV